MYYLCVYYGVRIIMRMVLLILIIHEQKHVIGCNHADLSVSFLFRVSSYFHPVGECSKMNEKDELVNKCAISFD